MKITFLRHAQSIFNVHLTSEKDCGLSPLGIEQAQSLQGEYDLIILSTLRRTHQTLLHSGIVGKRILITDLCREQRKDICDYLEGEDETDIEWENELEERIEAFKQYLRVFCRPDEKVLVISHGDFIDCATGRANYPENAEFRVWQFD